MNWYTLIQNVYHDQNFSSFDFHVFMLLVVKKIILISFNTIIYCTEAVDSKYTPVIVILQFSFQFAFLKANKSLKGWHSRKFVLQALFGSDYAFLKWKIISQMTQLQP